MRFFLKIITLFFVFSILGCTTYEQIKAKNPTDFKYNINCSGGLLTIESCKNTAISLCEKGYEELSRTDTPHNINLNRNMTVQCK